VYWGVAAMADNIGNSILESIPLVVTLLYLSTANHALSRNHPQETYAIWYIFSFFLLLFLALYSFAEREGKEIFDILGPSYADMLKFAYHMLTDVKGELILVAAVVYLAIGPQLLTYVLSGLSGSATPPMFVQQTATVAVWSVIKFAAGLGGILLAHPLVKLLMGAQVSVFDFAQGTVAIFAAFMLALAYYQYFESEFELEIVPGVLSFHISFPVLPKIHKFFTRRRPPAPPSDTESAPKEKREDEWLLELPGIIGVHLRGTAPLKIKSLLS
jgi:hypothetical protein